MIIQNTSLPSSALQPDTRVNSTPPGKTVTPPAPEAAAPVSTETLQSAVAKLNQVMRASNQSLEFSVDSNTHRTVVRMVDTATGELIRQFPSEATLAISRGIDEFQRGQLLTDKA